LEKLGIKPISEFLPASPVGEQTGDEKLVGRLFPWQPLVKSERLSIKERVDQSERE
jgi:hypothetical protein